MKKTTEQEEEQEDSTILSFVARGKSFLVLGVCTLFGSFLYRPLADLFEGSFVSFPVW
jgi:hypothetical protein